MTHQFDLIVIGAGPGGYEIAAEQARAGHKVALIERDLQGGTCLNRGCIPTKCLCASAEAALSAARSGELGVTPVGGVTLDYAAAVARMREVVNGLRADVEALTQVCTCFEGEASITPDGEVAVDGNLLSAQRVIIATGSRPAMLNIPGAELAMTSDDFLRLERLPQSCVVIGGGVIGMEFASIMAAFGTQVTVVEYCKEILPPFDAEIAKRLRTLLTRRGIKFVLGAAVQGIMDQSDGSRSVVYQGKRGIDQVQAAAVLMAVGRKPVVPDGLKEAGIEISERGGYIGIGSDLQTTRPGFYAVGDCNGLLMLAHAASAQARVAMGQKVDMANIPSAVFTSPEAAMVGQTQMGLDEMGVAYGVGKALYAANGKARAMAQSDGLVKVLYDTADRRLLGVHIVGAHAADLVAEAAIALHCGLTVDDIATHIVHGHPTLSEVLAAACRSCQ